MQVDNVVFLHRGVVLATLDDTNRHGLKQERITTKRRKFNPRARARLGVLGSTTSGGSCGGRHEKRAVVSVL
jgi:hypothetical protein